MKTEAKTKSPKPAAKPAIRMLRQKKDRLERGEVAPGRVFRVEKKPDGSLRRVELDPEKHRRKVAAEWKAKTEVARARQSLNLSQAAFSQLLGIGVATLRSWEQGKREPSGAARTLIGIAIKHPEVFEARE